MPTHSDASPCAPQPPHATLPTVMGRTADRATLSRDEHACRSLRDANRTSRRCSPPRSASSTTSSLASPDSATPANFRDSTHAPTARFDASPAFVDLHGRALDMHRRTRGSLRSRDSPRSHRGRLRSLIRASCARWRCAGRRRTRPRAAPSRTSSSMVATSSPPPVSPSTSAASARDTPLTCGRLRIHDAHDVLVSAGGDMRASGNGPGGDGWLVERRARARRRATQHPPPPRRGAGHIDDGGPATGGAAAASTTTSSIRARGVPAATGVRAASVVAPTAVEADVFAKTALILGVEEGLAFLDAQRTPGSLCGTTAAAYRAQTGPALPLESEHHHAATHRPRPLPRVHDGRDVLAVALGANAGFFSDAKKSATTQKAQARRTAQQPPATTPLPPWCTSRPLPSRRSRREAGDRPSPASSPSTSTYTRRLCPARQLRRRAARRSRRRASRLLPATMAPDRPPPPPGRKTPFRRRRAPPTRPRRHRRRSRLRRLRRRRHNQLSRPRRPRRHPRRPRAAASSPRASRPRHRRAVATW